VGSEARQPKEAEMTNRNVALDSSLGQRLAWLLSKTMGEPVTVGEIWQSRFGSYFLVDSDHGYFRFSETGENEYTLETL
jgi:hypothetical protein